MPDRNDLIEKWFKIKAKGNKLGYEGAKTLSQLLRYVANGSEVEFRIFLRVELGETRHSDLINMTRVYSLYPTPNLWETLGYRGLQIAYRLPDSKRHLFLEEALKLANNQPIKEVLLDKLDAKWLPPKERAISRSTSAHPAHERDALKQELLNIIREIPQAEYYLSPFARKLLGLPLPGSVLTPKSTKAPRRVIPLVESS